MRVLKESLWARISSCWPVAWRHRPLLLRRQPHAVDSAGGTSYTYDNNGNMLTRGSDNITWDAENRPVSYSGNSTATFVYDGNGNRVKKVEDGETVLYINKYYEINLTASENTSYYYLGNQLVATYNITDLRYVHQDHLTGTALVTSDNGSQVGTTMKYYPYGETRSGSVPTDKKFTGQRLDSIGLYYYNARYYDPTIGRFISADTIVQNPSNPQNSNRYSYVFNNPLRYTDPTGRWTGIEEEDSVIDIIWPENPNAGLNNEPPSPAPPPSMDPSGPAPADDDDIGKKAKPSLPIGRDTGEERDGGKEKPTRNVGRTALGIVYVTGGLLGTIIFGTLTVVGIIPGAALGELNVLATGYATVLSLSFLGEGIYMISDDKFGWVVPPIPF